MRSLSAIGLTTALICLWSVGASSTPIRFQTCVSKKSLALRTDRSLSSPQPEHLTFFLAQRTEESVKSEAVDSTRLKDPKMAVFYAIVPGILVHGAGHFYAGEKTTGWVLVAGEIVGIGMVTYSIVSGFGEAWGGADLDVDDEIAGFVGLTLFVGTWIYDVIGAPLAVDKQNRKLRGKKSVALKFEFDHRYDCVKIALIGEF